MAEACRKENWVTWTLPLVTSFASFLWAQDQSVTYSDQLLHRAVAVEMYMIGCGLVQSFPVPGVGEGSGGSWDLVQRNISGLQRKGSPSHPQFSASLFVCPLKPSLQPNRKWQLVWESSGSYPVGSTTGPAPEQMLNLMLLPPSSVDKLTQPDDISQPSIISYTELA